MHRMSATETIDLGSILDRVKPKTINIDIIVFLIDVQHYRKGQCEASTLCGRQMTA